MQRDGERQRGRETERDRERQKYKETRALRRAEYSRLCERSSQHGYENQPPGRETWRSWPREHSWMAAKPSIFDDISRPGKGVACLSWLRVRWLQLRVASSGNDKCHFPSKRASRQAGCAQRLGRLHSSPRFLPCRLLGLWGCELDWGFAPN